MNNIIIVDENVISVNDVKYIRQSAFGDKLINSMSIIEPEWKPDENGDISEYIQLVKGDLTPILVRIYRFQVDDKGTAYYLLSDYDEKIKPLLD